MYATQKYSARDRVETAQHWARQYPTRVAVIVSSPVWRFYCFKCLLVPRDMTVRQCVSIIHRQWNYKFASTVQSLMMRPVHGAKELISLDCTMDALAQTILGRDGLLYVTVHPVL